MLLIFCLLIKMRPLSTDGAILILVPTGAERYTSSQDSILSIPYILSRTTYPGAPSYGGVRTWAGLRAPKRTGTTRWLKPPTYWVAKNTYYILRPLKINCAFWVTSLVPFALSDRKTCALYFMFKVSHTSIRLIVGHCLHQEQTLSHWIMLQICRSIAGQLIMPNTYALLIHKLRRGPIDFLVRFSADSKLLGPTK